MRRVWFIAAFCVLAALAGIPAFAGNDVRSDTPIISCSNGIPGGVYCPPSKKDLKAAHDAYVHGVKLQDHKQLEDALAQFDEALRLVPQDATFLSAWEMTKAQLVFQRTERGDSLMAAGNPKQAAAEFRSALKLDADNAYTLERLAEAVRDPAAVKLGGVTATLADSSEIELQPKPELATFHYRGDVGGLFSALTSAYGVSAVFDDSALANVGKQVVFNVDEVDFFTALRLACRISKTMWTVLDAHQVLIANDSTENHKQFDRMALATFAAPGATTPQQATEMVTSLRNICDFQKISSGQNGTIEVRAPEATLRACMKLVQQLGTDRPQVSLDIEVFQVSHNFTREIGMHVPNTFNVYNIPEAAVAAALAALGGQSLSSLENQVISSGGINQAGSSALSGILAQLQSQTTGIFSQPLATFGGGLSFSGVSLDHITAALSLNESWSRSLTN